MKFTIQHVVYVIKQSVSPKMFTNKRLFTIQRLLFRDSTVNGCKTHTFIAKVFKAKYYNICPTHFKGVVCELF